MQYDCSLWMLQYLKVEVFKYCSCPSAILFTVEKLLDLLVNTDYYCCLWKCNYQRQQFAEITFFNLWKLCLRNLVLFTNYWFFYFRYFWPQPPYWLSISQKSTLAILQLSLCNVFCFLTTAKTTNIQCTMTAAFKNCKKWK